LAKVPTFMAANTFAGFVSFCAGPGPAAIDDGSGGTGTGVDAVAERRLPKARVKSGRLCKDMRSMSAGYPNAKDENDDII